MKLLLVVMLSMLVGCATSHPRQQTTQKRVAIGTVIGAGAGAIIGHNKGGKSGEGALIGGVVGALGGIIYDSVAGDPNNDVYQDHTHTPIHNPKHRCNRHFPYKCGCHHQETIIVPRKRTVYEEVPIRYQRYYIDEHGRKIFIDERGHRSAYPRKYGSENNYNPMRD